MEEKKELLDQDERVVEIELERLRGFVNHPFKVQADSQMIELQESIKKYGILNPLIVRPRQDGTYEIISGHRRKFAAEKIGYRKVPVIIRVLKDDEAVVSMVDSNLQREMISPSEKAFAYKMKYEAIKEAIHPNETLFVVDAMTGQDAVNTAREFNERLDFNGVILTKLDGDTRGGAALSIRTVVNKPIKYVGTGEKLEALDAFHPERMADRILGMGDIVSLVEKAQEQFDAEEAKKLQKKISRNQFNFNDFLSQIQQIKKMGNIKDLASMIPGVGKALKDIDIDDDAFKGVEAIIYSMTAAEREDPALINGSRRKRIAEGSGTTVQDVNRLLKQFEESKKMMKMLSGGGKLMRKMPGMRR